MENKPEITPKLKKHELKAVACGVHPHTLSAIQRKKVVPGKVDEFMPVHDFLVTQLAKSSRRS